MIKITGLDEIHKKFDEFETRAEAVGGNHSIPVPELLTPQFLSQHTRFAKADDFFSASGFEVQSPEDFTAIPDDKWDDFIRNNSSFSDWKSMLTAAVADWTKNKLGL